MPIARGICEDCGRPYIMFCKGCAAEAYVRRHMDLAQQALLNNLYSENPGELERWVDDGGRAP